MSKLAINGGDPIRTKPFPAQETIGPEESNAVWRVMNSKMLSGFRGNWIKEFWGGPEIRNLEEEWCKYFDVSHSLAVNSCTSALQIACGAIGLAPGDEVIVSPWSMSCSATAPLVWNAIPIFADIDPGTYCLDPEDVEKRITPRTKAIIVVDLFGQPYSEKIDEIAKKHDLWIIEDAAQAIGSKRNGKYSGTLGHIGCFSFTQGKHLTCGEGGMIVTNDRNLATKCAMIRNHAEAVISGMDDNTRHKFIWMIDKNMLGFNMRMTELQAAIVREQLKKLQRFVDMRRSNVRKIEKRIQGIVELPRFAKNRTHSYYVHAMKYYSQFYGVSRDKFVEALKAELSGEEGRSDRPLLGCGYIQPLYRMPLFRRCLLYGNTNYPWSLQNYKRPSYYHFPVVESLWKDTLFINMYHNLPLSEKDIDDIAKAFEKVSKNIGELIENEQ